MDGIPCNYSKSIPTVKHIVTQNHCMYPLLLYLCSATSIDPSECFCSKSLHSLILDDFMQISTFLPMSLTSRSLIHQTGKICQKQFHLKQNFPRLILASPLHQQAFQVYILIWLSPLQKLETQTEYYKLLQWFRIELWRMETLRY